MRDIQATVSRESQLQQAYSTKGLNRVSKVGGWGRGGGSDFEGPFPALGKEWENGLNLAEKKKTEFFKISRFPFLKGK